MKRGASTVVVLAMGLLGWRAAAAEPEPEAVPAGPPPAAEGWRWVTVARGVSHPWGIVWLPDGRALVTCREGTLHLVAGDRFEEVALEGLPEVYAGGQGGLLDLALHPADTNLAAGLRLYMTMSTGDAQSNRVILARGVFDGARVRGITEIFRAVPDKSGGQHFGSRLLWLPDGSLLMSVGDGGNPPLRVGDRLAREQAQNLRSHLGSIIRLTDAGAPAPGNPFLGRDDALPEIWTWGHRNIQGLARDAASGRVWATEHGPRGGDELNLIAGGRNYGWPLQTLGRDYLTGLPIGKPSVENMTGPKAVWIPAHAPSGLAFYTGDRFPRWRGSLLSGGLVAQDIRRIALDAEGRVTGQERLSLPWRVRDVKQGPDGHIYALTDEMDGSLLRIEPAPPAVPQ
jgi:glucose/arabinose dehydrogenase